jgi:hypothetical protein
MNPFILKRLTLALSLLLLLVACGREPIISSFQASHSEVTAGAEVTLSWQVLQADAVTLTSDASQQAVALALAGSRLETITATTTFTLTAVSGRRSASQTVTISVIPEGSEDPPNDEPPGDDEPGDDDAPGDDDDDEPAAPPVISSFTASPEATLPGGEVTLSWSVSGAETLTISGVGDVSGLESQTVTPNETTTFVLTATNAQGSDSAELTVLVGNAPVIEAFSASASWVNFGEPVNLSWRVSGADEVAITSVSGPLATTGTVAVNPTETTTYTLSATNAFASVTQAVTVDVWLTLMIAGQSNAVGWQPLDAPGVIVEQNTTGVMMFANDDSWKTASEPVDNNTGQNPSHGGYNDHPGHSFGLRLGNNLRTEAQRFQVALLPTAKGGTNVFTSSGGGWRPNTANVRNRTTVFGDALVRAELLKADQNLQLTGILWYQGEADSSGNCGHCNSYIANTKRVFNRMSEELNFSDTIPVFYVQLSHFGDDPRNNEATNNRRHKGWQDIREKQRLMEAGAYNPMSGTTSLCAASYMRMVVAHDLAMFDRSHLTAASQKILGDRLDRAIREHLLGENIDGTGPRLASISKSGNVIRIATTRTINDSSTYGNYFAVFDGAGNQVAITSMGRDNSQPTDVLLTLANDPGPNYSVRYMPPRIPQGDNPPSNGVGLPADLTDEVIHHVTADGFKLPLPAFGRMVEFPSTLDPNFATSDLAGQCTNYDVINE